jgi:hypothetical protein
MLDHFDPPWELGAALENTGTVFAPQSHATMMRSRFITRLFGGRALVLVAISNCKA